MYSTDVVLSHFRRLNVLCSILKVHSFLIFFSKETLLQIPSRALCQRVPMPPRLWRKMEEERKIHSSEKMERYIYINGIYIDFFILNLWLSGSFFYLKHPQVNIVSSLDKNIFAGWRNTWWWRYDERP